MSEKPILFSAPMVRAILAGTKSQTRRVVRPQPDTVWNIVENGFGFQDEHALQDPFTCPYGKPGDRLWVKETHAIVEGQAYADGCADLFPIYRADGDDGMVKWKPSIFMRREYSRITLEIVSVRVERLQEISHRDALAEGVAYDASKADGAPVPRYKSLWESINGKGSWAANPWVWVVEFRRVEP